MRHLSLGLLVSVAVMGSASVALAAEYIPPPEMRGTYNSWDEPTEPLMDFEAGVRYWYSVGSQSGAAGSSTFSTSDQTHTGELYLRLNDRATNTYLKAYGGYSGLLSGNYASSDAAIGGTFDQGRVAYFTTDFGYNVLSNDTSKMSSNLGIFAGYQYLNERASFEADFLNISGTSDVDWDRTNGDPIFTREEATQELHVNALRLGVAGDVDIDGFTLSGEVAAIPYAMVRGTLATPIFSTVNTATNTQVQAGSAAFTGSGYGAAAQLMIGKTIDNWNFRIGGRANYVRASGTATYNVADIDHATDADVNGTYETDGTVALVNTSSPVDAFSMWRYGILAEISVDF